MRCEIVRFHENGPGWKQICLSDGTTRGILPFYKTEEFIEIGYVHVSPQRNGAGTILFNILKKLYPQMPYGTDILHEESLRVLEPHIHEVHYSGMSKILPPEIIESLPITNFLRSVGLPVDSVVINSSNTNLSPLLDDFLEEAATVRLTGIILSDTP